MTEAGISIAITCEMRSDARAEFSGTTAIAQEPAVQPAVGKHAAQLESHPWAECWQSAMQAACAIGCALVVAGENASASTAKTTSKRRATDLTPRQRRLVIETSSFCRHQTNVREGLMLRRGGCEPSASEQLIDGRQHEQRK
jgi:hypothetical protein